MSRWREAVSHAIYARRPEYRNVSERKLDLHTYTTWLICLQLGTPGEVQTYLGMYHHTLLGTRNQGPHRTMSSRVVHHFRADHLDRGLGPGGCGPFLPSYSGSKKVIHGTDWLRYLQVDLTM